MVNQQLLDYVRGQLHQGATKEQIKTALVSNGWLLTDIEEAFGIVAPVVPPVVNTPQATTTPIINTMVQQANNVTQKPEVTTSPIVSSLGQVNTQQTTPIQTKQVLPGVFASLKSAWALIKSRFGVVVTITLLNIFIFFGGFLFRKFNPFLGNEYVDFINLFVDIVVIVLSAWNSLALMHAIVFAEEKLSLGSSYSEAGRRLFSYWWLMLLSGFTVFGGFVLLIIPGIIVSFWFLMAQMVWAKEGLRGSKALLKSKWYVKGYIWAILSRNVGVVIIGIAISIIISIPLTVANVDDVIIDNINYSLFAPITLAFIYTIYKNLKSIKGEGYPGPTSGEKNMFWGLFVLGIVTLPLTIYFLITAIDRAFEGAGLPIIM